MSTYRNSLYKRIILYVKKNHPSFFDILLNIHSRLFPVLGKDNIIKNQGHLINSKISVRGNNNRIYISHGCILHNVELHIRGDNHIIEIGSGCKVYEWGSFWCEGENNKIIIGDDTTIRSAHLCAQERNTSIIIGNKCMLSNNLEIRTSDSHPYYDIQTGERLNNAKSVCIGNHVWICAKVTILKGANICDNSIIGYGSILSSNVPSNSIATGKPAKIIRNNIYWDSKF